MDSIKTCLSFILIFIFYGAIAQEAGQHLSFEKKNINLGEVYDKDGSRTALFKFTNTGSEAALIDKIETSCGCTTAEYPTDTIFPGQNGIIKVLYNSLGQKNGGFTNIIKVLLDNGDEYGLIIRGKVMPTTIELFPYKCGKARLDGRGIDFGMILDGKQKAKTLKILNTSDEDVNIDFNDKPDHIDIKTNQGSIKPNEKLALNINYNTEKSENIGIVVDTFHLNVDSKSCQLRCLAIIKEDFSQLSEKKRKNAPSININKTDYNLGHISSDTTYNIPFIIENKGKSKLIIRKIENFCTQMNVEIEKRKIKPGEKAKLNIIYKPQRNNECKQTTITVISNDPEKDWVRLKIKGIVTK